MASTVRRHTLQLKVEKYVDPVPTYYAVIRLQLRNPNPKPNSDCRPFELKIGTLVTLVLENVHANFALGGRYHCVISYGR